MRYAVMFTCGAVLLFVLLCGQLIVASHLDTAAAQARKIAQLKTACGSPRFRKIGIET